MIYISRYASPLGSLLLEADDIGLTGILFREEESRALYGRTEYEEKDTPVTDRTKKWLDIYFAGRDPEFLPKMHMTGTPFRMSVWELLLQIPYGQTVTYGEIAERLAKRRGLAHMSARAVGGAAGHNRIPIIIPCHRVVGADKNLTGFTGGIDIKCRLLELEGLDLKEFYFPS